MLLKAVPIHLPESVHWKKRPQHQKEAKVPIEYIVGKTEETKREHNLSLHAHLHSQSQHKILELREFSSLFF